MKQPEEFPPYTMDADEECVVMLVLSRALGLPYEVRLIGDRKNWVSVEVVGRPQV